MFAPPAKAAHRRLTLALLAFASLITSLDYNIVYVALPEIGSGLGFSAHTLQWVVSAYAVAFGGFLLLGGRASDLLGGAGPSSPASCSIGQPLKSASTRS